MKRKQIQYAEPYKIRSVQSVFNADDGIAGYDVEVCFNGTTNIPQPRWADPENIYVYQDVNAGTSRVVYYFPFVGHGVINFGKLAAEHWFRKMLKQIVKSGCEVQRSAR
jgi:hypothetical protein